MTFRLYVIEPKTKMYYVQLKTYNLKDTAKRVFDIEIESLKEVANSIGDDFTAAVNAILESKGKLIVAGVGKSGLIGRKIAATLASTGTPSFFLHPGEAFHGDLGMVEHNDLVILISYSGETDEILKIIPFLKWNNNRIIRRRSIRNNYIFSSRCSIWFWITMVSDNTLSLNYSNPENACKNWYCYRWRTSIYNKEKIFK